MSSLKTIAGFALTFAAIAVGARSQRQYEIEADRAVRPIVEDRVRMDAVDYNPKVALTRPEPMDFSLVDMKITASRLSAFLDSAFRAGSRNYDVYVRFRESGDSRCMTLRLEWMATEGSWKTDHSGLDDRCAPVW